MSIFVRRMMTVVGCLGMAFVGMGCNSGVETIDNPFDAVQLNRQAQIYVQNGEFAKAEALLRQSLDNNYENPVSHYWLGQALEGQGRVENAIYAYRLAVRFGPSVELYHMALIMTLEHDGQQEESFKAAQAFLAYVKFPMRDYLRFAEEFRKQQMVDHELLVYITAADVLPTDAQPCVAAADIYKAAGDKDHEIEWLTRAVKADPFYPGLSKRLAGHKLRLDITPPAPAPPSPSEKRLKELEID